MLLSFLCAMILVATIAASQAPPASALKSYPVLLEGTPVFEIQWGYGNFSPQLRATTISSRLKRIADDPSIKPQISLQPNDVAIDLVAGNVILVSVYAGDAKAAGISNEELAGRWQSAAERAIAGYRARYSWQRKVVRGVAALLVLALTVLLLIGLRRGTRALSARCVTHLHAKIHQARKQVLTLIPNSQIDKVVPRFFGLLRLALSICILLLAFESLLWIYPPTRSLAGGFVNAVAGPIKSLGAKLWANLPNLFLVLLIAVATWYVLRFVRYFFDRIADGTISFAAFRPRWAQTTQRLVSILVVICALLVAYPYIPGSDTPAFQGITLFIGVLASIGSAGVVPNMISGIMLTYMDAFQVGDLVRIGNTYGVVHETAILSTSLRSRATELITIPNSMIWSNNITNFSRQVGDGATIVAKVGIGYDAPWRQVEAILMTAASRTVGARKSPRPYVLTASLDQFNVTYELHVFLDAGATVYQVQSDLNQNILDGCNEFGVQIMTPAYEEDPAQAKVVGKEQWFAAPAAVSNDGEPELEAPHELNDQGKRKVA